MKIDTNQSGPFSDIDKILSLARFAPSSHNTQPWTIKRQSPNSLTIGYRSERQLKIGDPNKRELFISLGCFIETIRLASLEQGYKAVFSFISSDPTKVGVVKFKKFNSNESWQKIIMDRRSDRRFYNNRKIPTVKINKLRSLSSTKVSVNIFDEKNDIDFLSMLTYDATLRTMLDKNFREELANWVRNNWTKKPDGMPGYTQGMPGLISLAAKFVILHSKSVAKNQAKKDSARITKSSAIGLICVSKQQPAEWIQAGQIYQHMCLESLKNNIKSSAISAAVIDNTTRKKIEGYFSLKGTPVILLRFGYTSNVAKAAPRLLVKDFTIS